MTSRTCGAVFGYDTRGGERACKRPEGHTGGCDDGACECEHPQVRTDDGRWFALVLIGYQIADVAERGDAAAVVFELRNCPRCETTRSRPVTLKAMVRTVNGYIRLRRMFGALADPERAKSQG